MHLNNYPASAHFGKAAYGTSAVSIQGATPALLAGRFAGGPFGPSWYTGTDIIYQDGGTGSGPYVLNSYNVTTPAVTTQNGAGENFLAAGGGVWAARLDPPPPIGYVSGVRANIVISASAAALAAADVKDVSVDGNVVLLDFFQQATGLTVYNDSGASIFTLPTVTITNPIVRLVGDLLSYQDAQGWHIKNITTGAFASWCPPLDAVAWLVPVTMSDGSLWVVEVTNNLLRVRAATANTAWIAHNAPTAFNPDAIAYSAGVMRLGWCLNAGESLDSLNLMDLTLATGANSLGVVSGGTVVFSSQAALSSTSVQVGPNEATGEGDVGDPPFPEKIVDQKTGLLSSLPWAGWFTGLKRKVVGLATTMASIPKMPPAPSPSFGRFAFQGQPNVQAFTSNDVLTDTSDDGSISVTQNPFTKTRDWSVNFPDGPWLVGDVVELDDDAIKALPTTSVDVIPASDVPAGFRITEFLVDVQMDLVALYTNINANGILQLENDGTFSNFITNDSSIPLTRLDTVLGNPGTKRWTWRPFVDAEPVNGWGNLLATTNGDGDGEPLVLSLNNQGSGDLTDGHADNTMTLRPYYILSPVVT